VICEGFVLKLRGCKNKMAIQSPRYPFEQSAIGSAPSQIGVYWLWDGDEIIFISHVTGNATIRSCLKEHYAGDHGTCTQKATHYGWEFDRFPVAREAELLGDFVSEHGRRPRCMRG